MVGKDDPSIGPVLELNGLIFNNIHAGAILMKLLPFLGWVECETHFLLRFFLLTSKFVHIQGQIVKYFRYLRHHRGEMCRQGPCFIGVIHH